MGTTSIKLITSDGIELGWGVLSDGGVLTVSGQEVVTTEPATPTYSGTATLAFGSSPSESTSVVVAGQSWVTASSEVQAFFMASSTAGNDAENHKQAAVFMRLIVGSLVVGVGFTIFAWCKETAANGDFTVCWEGS